VTVVTVLMLSNPTPERAIVDTVVDVVSHEVGMV
jgi:hypothetical protein